MNADEPLTSLKSSNDGAAFGQALYFRIAMREQTKLQGQFLQKIGASPFSPQFVLCGGTALHGVYLHQRCSKNIDLYAPPALAPRFYELALACGVQLEKRRVFNSFVLGVRSTALSDLRIEVRVMVQPFLFQSMEPSVFVAASGTNIGVNALPLADLVAQKLMLTMQRSRAVDVLDLWLAFKSKPDLINEVSRLLRSNPAIVGSQLFSCGFMLSRLSVFEETWESTLRSVIYPMPDFEAVRQDLNSWLLQLQMAN